MAIRICAYRRPALMLDTDRRRLQRYLAAWEARLARDREYLKQLRQRLQSAGVTPAASVPPTLVTLHSVLRLRELEYGRAFVWTVTLPTDQEVATAARSPVSWAGAVLLGAQEGDVVQWTARADGARVRIETVLFQPQRSRQSPVENGRDVCWG